MPENHPLLCDGAVKASEGEGDLSSCAAKMGDGQMGVGMELLKWSVGSGRVSVWRFYGGFGLDLRALRYDSQHE